MNKREPKLEMRSVTIVRPGDFPLGSTQSRAAARLRLQGDTSKGSPACICFPENEPAFFLRSEDQEIAAKVECPLHGKRVSPGYHIHVAGWRWRQEVERRWLRRPQYHKAFTASFSEKQMEWLRNACRI